MPGLGGASAARCCAGSIAAVQAVEHDVGRQVAQRLGGPLDLGHAGQEGEQRAVMLAQRVADRRGHLRLDPLRRVAAFVDQGQRIAFALAFDLRRIAQQPGEPLAVERRRHRQDAQVGPQALRRIERQGQRQVAVEAALMDFVEQHRATPSSSGSACSRDR